MSINHLEQLVAEWYEYRGYFVRRNVHVGPRPEGGYEGELDVVAFHPQRKTLVHVEPSLDADTWTVREKRFKKKFDTGRKYIPQLFKGVELPSKIDQIAVLVFASKANHTTLGGGKIVLVGELLRDIADALSGVGIDRRAVPEQFPLLRTIQYMIHYKDMVFRSS